MNDNDSIPVFRLDSGEDLRSQVDRVFADTLSAEQRAHLANRLQAIVDDGGDRTDLDALLDGADMAPVVEALQDICVRSALRERRGHTVH
jgi:hypothetical protein